MNVADTAKGRSDGDQKPAVPSISLPKGGGAIRSIGEKFGANPVTGTASMSVPIATSPGRSGFGPQLSLSYDSGAGNGPFGFGWTLSLPSISRKTDKGLPRYADAIESDVFILSGAEDLVPLDRGADWSRARRVEGVDYRIDRYRPRIESLFARIERWTRLSDDDVHWRSISSDNILSVYGEDGRSRIADPEDPRRVFSWLIAETRDDKGNAVLYEYKPEDGAGADLTRAHERNRGERDDPRRTANRYLKRIRYGNRVPLLDAAGRRPPVVSDLLVQGAGWLFDVVFDYGEHDVDAPTPEDGGEWRFRADPFSSYRAGFEIRTTRLCRRVLMFHHFPGEEGVGNDCLVRSTDFHYSAAEHAGHVRRAAYAFLRSVAHAGYKRENGGYLHKSVPPVEFEYTQPVVHDTVREVDRESVENLPIGLDGEEYQWIDLHGEGVPGILSEQAGAWFYKRNLSPARGDAVQLGPVETVPVTPNPAVVRNAQFMDVAGDGRSDLVVLNGPLAGVYEHDREEGWRAFRPFTFRLNRNMRDADVKFVDLDGDGRADVLITENDALVWHPSLAEAGFGPSRRVAQALDEEKGPRVVFDDGTQSIHLADLSGDGLADLVRIRNGEVCYWPNLGYGRFGAKITMDRAPWFDHPDQFEYKRIRLADIDGTGTTDIIYLHRDGVRLYFNQSGNGWSEPEVLHVFPRPGDLASIAVADLLGNGTACLVWSSAEPADARAPLRYVSLMGPQKPHLLAGVINNLGAETRLQYAPSTKFYVRDKLAGRPWITRLPFPVHVLERSETYDLVSRNRFVTRYAYHHGHYDGVEREFRGFGLVEQFDTEELAALARSGDLRAAANVDAASYVPTVLTRTWFHTGAYLEGGRISRHYEREYYREGDASEGSPGLTDEQLEAMLLPDTELPTAVKNEDGSWARVTLTPQEAREACRALKGSVLRREVYALDGTDAEDRPYSVSEQNYTIQLLQRRGDNRHAIYVVHPRESLDFHYERKLVDVAGRPTADPRVTHAMSLEVDSYGNVLKSVAIGYGRRPGLSALEGDDRRKQERILVTYAENAVTNPIDAADDHRIPSPCESSTYELLGIAPDHHVPDITNVFGFAEMAAKARHVSDGSHDVPYEYTPVAAANVDRPSRRLIEQTRTLYRRNDLASPLPARRLESLAIPFEKYKLALTPGVVLGAYGPKITEEMLVDEGRYVRVDGDVNWWIPSGTVFFDVDSDIANPTATAAQELAGARAHFFLPRKFVDPFGQATTVKYDRYDLALTTTQDALGSRVVSRNDYRVLQPSFVTDPNGNRAAVSFDGLGLVAGTAVMGKKGETFGDSLDGFMADLSQDEVDGLARSSDPVAAAAALLGNATTRIVYDVDRFRATRAANPDEPALWEPAFVATLTRETHVSDLQPGHQTRIQIGFSHSDGFGREIQKKIQAEPGPLREAGPIVSPRWVGTGWTIFNNKGKPVRQYEPFFDDTHAFKFGVAIGVSPVVFYDPVERAVATLHPDHTYGKVVFDPWQQRTWDVNDTVTLDPRTDGDVSAFFTRLRDTEYLPTWYALRTEASFAADAAALWPDPQTRATETDAANKAAVHARTPSVAHADSLGRAFLTIAHNRSERNGTNVDEKFATRTELDIEGNLRAVIDAKGRVVMRYDYDVAGTRIRQAGMDAGERWILNDVAGKPLYAWDSRGHRFRTVYDPLRRPIETWLRDGDGPDLLVSRTIYGETEPHPEATNRRGKVVRFFDQAGLVTTEDYDFRGNLLQTRRQFAREYKTTLDWSADPELEAEVFTARTSYDALNRPVSGTAPDNSVYRPAFNEANLLESVNVNVRGAAAPTPFVTNIDYDVKGRRALIEYGNGAKTEYSYDPLTFRLRHLTTTRLTDGAVLQDLRYTYDPIGNITDIRDAAQQTVYFNNQVAAAGNRYTYDAIYRLIDAEGREHIGQASDAPITWDDRSRTDVPQPGDGQAMRRYAQHYEYDSVGNIARVVHRAVKNHWTRRYVYAEPSALESVQNSNRLSETIVGVDDAERYRYDGHGNVIAMPHLTLMDWDFKDQLHAIACQAVNGGTPETTYYVYDGAGQRVRKITERQDGTRKNERSYLSSVEVYREYASDVATPVLERETLHVLDDKQRVALVETQTVDTSPVSGPHDAAVRYQLANHLGSVCVEVDAAARIVSYEEYYPYGSTSYQAGRSVAEVSLKRYRYGAMERDEESGLEYHTARYYAPWLGRWTSADPAGLVDGPGLYSFARNNPVNHTDGSGTDTVGTLVEYQRKGTGQGSKIHQLHFFPESIQKKINPGWTRELSEAHKELVYIASNALNARVDAKLRKYAAGIDNIRDKDQLLSIIHDVQDIWVEAGVPKDIVQKWTTSAYSTARKIGILKKPIPTGPSVLRRTSTGEVTDAVRAESRLLGKIGKVAKIVTIVQGVLVAGDALADVFTGHPRRAAEKIAGFAYDQTIGAVVDAASLVKDIAVFVSDPLAGVRDRINAIKQMQDEQDALMAEWFLNDEKASAPEPPPAPPAPPPPAPARRDRGTLYESILLWTLAVGLAVKGSAVAPEAVSADAPAEKIDLGDIDCDAVDLDTLNDYLYSCAEVN